MKSNRILAVIYLSVVLSFICSVPSMASGVDEKIEKGNSYYRDGAYDKAIEEYNKVIDKGYLGTSLFYNLGNSYYRIGKIGFAILFYEKALKLSPSDEDAIHNLNFARLSTVDRVQPLPRFFLFDWWESLLRSFSANGWAYLGLVFYLLLIFFITAYFFARSIKQQKLIFFSGIAAVFFFAFSISILAVKVKRDAELKSGVIIEQVVTVKSSPNPKSTDSFVIHEGLKVSLEDNLDNWVKIRLADGKVGWIENKLVEQI
jgi:tetratricopeptide (TPR) repeat protein